MSLISLIHCFDSSKSLKGSSRLYHDFNPSKPFSWQENTSKKKNEKPRCTSKDQGSTRWCSHSMVAMETKGGFLLCLTRAHPCVPRHYSPVTRYYIHRDEYRSEQGEQDRSSSTSNGTLVFWKRATSPRRSSNPAISVPHNLPDCIPPRRRIIPLVLSSRGLYLYWYISKERRGERPNRENSTFSPLPLLRRL